MEPRGPPLHRPRTPPLAKKLFIKTYGCQMNVYDSERMTDLLAPIGYAVADRPEAADLVILNTCHIREKASEKVYSELGRLRRLKDQRRTKGGNLTLAVAGCVAQADGAEMRRRAPYVDIVMGPQAYHRLPEYVARAERAAAGPAGQAGVGILDTEFPVESKFDHLPAPTRQAAVSTFVSIQEGCDKFCTFCVVPYTRGAEFSRPLQQIVDETRRRVDNGAREVTLLGQNVNAYHGAALDGDANLAELIDALADIDGLARIRYTTSHPRDMDADLIAAHGSCAKLMPFLHLPVQSGSDRILAAMNRQHTAADYHRIVGALRDARPDLALSSDFIVGYPGETDADFEATLDLVRTTVFAQAYSFKYSARPGTPAAALQDQVPEAAKDERLQALQALLNEQQRAASQAIVGRTTEVLLERPGRHQGQLVGRTMWNQPVQANLPPSYQGSLAKLHIDACAANSLDASLPDTTDMRACA